MSRPQGAGAADTMPRAEASAAADTVAEIERDRRQSKVAPRFRAVTERWNLGTDAWCQAAVARFPKRMPTRRAGGRSGGQGPVVRGICRTAKAAASPKRIEVLELLAQGERTVEALARATGMGVTNTSAHLQLLRHARLVDTRKDGTRVFYRLAGDEVAAFVAVLRDLARSRLAEVDQVVRDYFGARDALEPVSRSELVERARRGDVV